MGWKVYHIALRLKTPLHAGRGQSGNLLVSGTYVTGRTLWGALTARLTRDSNASPNAKDYRDMGGRINEQIAFTYFYPAIRKNNEYRLIWPWSQNQTDPIRASRIATALDNYQGTSENGALFEVECIPPYDLDACSPVYLIGYIFAMDDELKWENVLDRLQLGSERCYGWGRVTKSACDEIQIGKSTSIFNGMVSVDISDPTVRPKLFVCATANAPGRLLAHTRLAKGKVQGETEPLVTREWQAGAELASGPGRKVKYHGVFYSPGSKVFTNCQFLIGKNGIWEAIQSE
ncbi:hypothetical protein Dvar_26940 [Desulfosarcina variabilis str. Montpellier]|uniref:hypothetical protein n=1 Tax=Desulfosarcina variabilis TaxID=2300 RepID=UPI003AFB73FA